MRPMKCRDVEGIRPLDRLIEENSNDFNSGEERECDKDLDAMIWNLNDFENEMPKQEAAEFADDLPIEEDLVEGEKIGGGTGRASKPRGGRADEALLDGVELASAHSISPATRKRKRR